MKKPPGRHLKVGFVHPDLGIGGAERLVLDVAVALKAQQHEVYFITNHYDKNHAFQELKDGEFPVQVIGDWLPRSILGKFQALCAYIRMVYLIIVYLCLYRKDDLPDVFFIDSIPIAIPFLKWANQRVIYYCHHPDLLASTPGGRLKKIYRAPLDWLELKATKKADFILVNSNYTASVFRKTFPEIQKALHVLYPTISHSFLEAVQHTSPKRIHDIVPSVQEHEGNVIFLSINRFHPAKRLGLAVKGLKHLESKVTKEEWARIYLILAGGYDPISSINSTCYSELLQLVKECELNDKVIFLKSPSDSAKVELLLSCTCLIYSPVNEHFGIVPLEAMAAGKPVIACNSGGPTETVEDSKTGYLCDPTPDSMAECMSKILHENCQDMGARGKRRLEDNFSYNQFSSKLSDLLMDMEQQTKVNS